MMKIKWIASLICILTFAVLSVRAEFGTGEDRPPFAQSDSLAGTDVHAASAEYAAILVYLRQDKRRTHRLLTAPSQYG